MGDRQRLATNTLSVFVDYGARITIALVTFPFLIHAIGLENYGIYILISAFSGYLGLLDLGITQAVTREISARTTRGDRGEVSTTTSSSLVVLIIAGVISATTCTLLATTLPGFFDLDTNQRDIATTLFLFLGITLLFGFAQGLFRAMLAGIQRFDLVALIGIVDTVGKTAAILWVLMTNGSVIELAFYTLLASQAGPILAAALIQRRVPSVEIRVSGVARTRIGETVRFGGVLSYMAIAGLLVYQTDAVILGVFTGALGLAVYSVAQKVNTVLRQVEYLMASSVMPAATAFQETGQTARTRRMILEGTFYSHAVLAPAALIILVMADPIVRFWVGELLIGAVPLLQVYVLYIVTYSTENVLWQSMIGIGKIRQLVRYVTSLVGLNLALSVYLTSELGPIGVVLGTAISYVLLHGWYLKVTLSAFEIPAREFVKMTYLKVLPIAAAGGAVVFLLQSAYPANSLAVAGTYCLIGYVIAIYGIYRVMMNNIERENARRTVSSLLRKFRPNM